MKLASPAPWSRSRALPPAWVGTPVRSLFAEVDRLLDEMWPEAAPPAERRAAFAPAIDVEDTDGALRVTADLPGLDEKAVEVSVEDDVLTIRGERRDERDAANARGRVWRERSYGGFHRAIRLPEDVDGANATATFANGVLTVSVPKRPERKPRKIAVTAA